MKKLSLKNLKLGVNDILQRDHLKSVLGGYYAPGCKECKKNGDCGSGVCATGRPGCPGKSCL